jgi:hypothetical protein
VVILLFEVRGVGGNNIAIIVGEVQDSLPVFISIPFSSSSFLHTAFVSSVSSQFYPFYSSRLSIPCICATLLPYPVLRKIFMNQNLQLPLSKGVSKAKMETDLYW